MKRILFSVVALISFTLKAQNMKSPSTTVVELFIATDNQNWSEVEQLFNEKVLLDYSSMTGIEASTLTPDDIVKAWKTILPGFEHTHHQIGNITFSEKGNAAHVFCYVTATHFLENESGGNVWTVVGSYDFELVVTDGKWSISKMKFNYKYQDGNLSLPEIAIQNAK